MFRNRFNACTKNPQIYFAVQYVQYEYKFQDIQMRRGCDVVDYEDKSSVDFIGMSSEIYNQHYLFQIYSIVLFY